MALSLPHIEPGSVWLVGAGPGDPGLLTLLAADALRQADIILYDSLVNPEILGLIGPQGRAVAVGRRKGRVTATVEQTIALMLRHAALGRKVVRLKGGDPFIFGHGSEEVAALVEAGIPFRVVPGVTAGIGGLAYAGIVATRRGVNEMVTLVTGHGRDGALPEAVDWARLAGGNETLVVYMGLGTLDEIARTLLAHGRDHLTPVAIVSEASTARQQTLLTTLGESVLAARRARVASPALIVIGAAAAPDNIFTWFDPAAATTAAGHDAPALDAARG